MTGGSATCVARDRNYSCASGQTLEKIVDGNPVCVAKDGEYTCASGQVLKEVKNGAAVCVDRDASYGCGEGQVLKNVNNGSPTCVDMDKAYNCGENYDLQATSTGGAVCVDKDRGVTGCPWGQFAYGISYGMPLCAQVYNAALSSAAVPVCNGNGQALQFDGTNWSCQDLQIGYNNCYWTDWQNEWVPGVAICPDGYTTQAVDITWWDPRDGDADSIRTQCCQLYFK